MFNRRNALIAALLSACAGLLSSCGVWQAVSDTSSSAFHAVFFKKVKVLNLDLVSRAGLNPDDAGRATSVVVRVYQLKDRQSFDHASYDDLLKKDQTALAQDKLADMATVVNPGASASLSQPMQDATKYVAVVAFYRDPGTGNSWKYVIAKNKLTADRPLRLELLDNGVQAAGAGQEKSRK